MHFTVYKTTNIINGKVYIGSHITKNIHDDYLGSGKYLKQAINKYGRENFTKEVLYVFDNRADMNSMERSLVNEAFVKDRQTYNATVGGSGGGNIHLVGKTDRYDEIIQKISRANTGKVRSNECKELHRKLRTAQSNPKNAKSLSKTWLIIRPDGTEEVITNLTKYCRDNKLDARTMNKVGNGQRKQHKHFSVRKLD